MTIPLSPGTAGPTHHRPSNWGISPPPNLPNTSSQHPDTTHNPLRSLLLSHLFSANNSNRKWQQLTLLYSPALTCSPLLDTPLCTR